MRIHLVPNSHIDPVWLWNKQEGIDEVINTFRSACDRLDEYPDLTFSASSLQFYEWVQQFDAALFDRIAAHVAEGRWEVAGGWWVEADTNLPTEASFIKHAEISGTFCRKYFGRDVTVAYLPDTFGHPATLPKVLAQTGFKYLVFCRPGVGEKPDLSTNLFHWEYGGHRVLAYRLKHHYTQGGCGGPRLLAMLGDEEYTANPVNAFFFGMGDHGGGPTIAEIQFFNRFLSGRSKDDAGYSTCQRFFDEASRLPGIPVYHGDLHRHAVGCYSVLRGLKEAVRRAEHSLQFAGRARAMNDETDACLAPAWKTTLFNQFHDILPGSCSPEAAEQAVEELGGVQSAARDAAYRALKSLSMARPACAPQGEFRIFNTLPFEVTGPLQIESFMYYRPDATFRDETGRAVAIQEVLPSVRCANRRWEFVDTLPARGFKAYHFDDATRVERPAPESVHFTGAACGNPVGAGDTVRFLVLDDPSDTWGHGVERYAAVEGAFEQVGAASLSGPVSERVYQRWRYGSSTLEAVYTTYSALPGTRLELRVCWGERRKLLKVEVDVPGAATSLVMQGAGGPIERPADGKEQPLHHWVWFPAAGGGLAVLQEGAFACDGMAERLRLTFVRSSVYGLHDPCRLHPDDPQRFTDLGEHRMRLLLLRPHVAPDADALDRQAAAFLEPCAAIRESPRL